MFFTSSPSSRSSDESWLQRRRGSSSEVRSQYCPLCIREFGYYQLSWTITLYSCCLRHSCLLQENCPHCGKPFRDALRTFNSYVSDPDKHLQHCAYCAGSFGDARVELADEKTLEINCTLRSLSKKITCYNYFAVLHELTYLICSRSVLAKGMRLRMRLDENQYASRDGKGNLSRFNHQNAKSRAAIVHSVISLFKDWPFYFIHLVQSIDHKFRTAKYKFLPDWYLHVAVIAEARNLRLRAGYRQEFLDIASREQWGPAVQLAECTPTLRHDNIS
jgi:hypothetical protein